MNSDKVADERARALLGYLDRVDMFDPVVAQKWIDKNISGLTRNAIYYLIDYVALLEDYKAHLQRLEAAVLASDLSKEIFAAELAARPDKDKRRKK